MKIKKRDKVKVLLGKDKGKEGTIEYVLSKDKRVFVSGANLYKRHVRKVQNMEGGIIDIPKSMDISNVGLICPSCKKVTRVGFRIVNKEKMRICKKCGKEIANNVKK